MGLMTIFRRILNVLTGHPGLIADENGRNEPATLARNSLSHARETVSGENPAGIDSPKDVTADEDWEDPFNGLAIEVPIEDQIDLHTFAPDETEDVLNAYIEAARDHGFRRLRIVHGRGTGVQRAIVRAYLGRHYYVQSFSDALPEEGGWGATIVILKV